MQTKKLFTLVVIAIFLLGLGVRLYHFPERVIFTLEQGITLQTTYDYLHDKFSLLGLVNIQRYTSTGMHTYSAPLYNYLLMPVMYVLGTDPIRFTYFAVATNMFTALMLYFLIKKLSGRRVALYSTLFFLFNGVMISQSLTIWILNPIPLVGLLGMYLLIKYRHELPPWPVLALGILSGIATGMEWMCLATAGLLAVYILYKSAHKIRDLSLFSLGFAIAFLPTIIFDLRHDWYHLRTLWQYLLDTIKNPEQGGARSYHFFHFLPLWFYFLGFVGSWLSSKKRYYLGYLIAGIYVVYNSVIALQTRPLVNAPTLLEIGGVIASAAKQNYNVVYTPEAEYRAYTLRYILTSIYHKPPMSIEAYPSAEELYVVALAGRNLDSDIPWEVSSFKPTTRTMIYASPDKRVLLYKLSK